MLDQGACYVTAGIVEKMQEDHEFLEFVATCFARHLKGDWGDLCPEDKQANEIAILEGTRILSAYIPKDINNKIYIITEADRSATTALFPDEY